MALDDARIRAAPLGRGGRINRFCWLRLRRPILHRRDGPGQSEVHHPDPAVGGDQDVLRLEVAVQNVGAVRLLQRPAHGQPDTHRLAGEERSLPDPLP